MVFGSHLPSDVKFRQDLMESVIGEWSVEIGGFTTDWIAVNPGGEVDYGLARSVPLGIQRVISDFEESFRNNNLKAVKDTPVLPPERVRNAIATGVFEGAGKKYPCEKEVQEATNLLLNRVADMYPRIAGGALGWDAIILAGGGSRLLHKPAICKPQLSQEKRLSGSFLNSITKMNRPGLRMENT